MDGALDWLLVRYGIQKATQIIGHISFSLVCRPAFRSKTTESLLMAISVGIVIAQIG